MKGFRFTSVFFLLGLFCNIVFASADSNRMFIRMNIEIDSSQVRLIRASVYSGEIQQSRLAIEHRTDPLLFRVMSNTNKIVFEDTLQDPRTLFFDEPDLSGRLHGGMIQNTKGVATVVIPFSKNTHKVDFYHRSLGSEDERALQPQHLESLGSIALNEIKSSMSMERRRRSEAPVNIQKTGKPENRIDIVFLAEGFKGSERATFLTVVRRVVDSWKLLFPWSEYFRLLNIYAVPLVSADSGADRPGVNKNTALDSIYGCFDIPRLICIDYDKAFAEASESVPQFDFAIAVVNDPEYGGSGGPVAVFSINIDAQQIFFHEFAHTFASLADEYDAENPNPPPFTESLYPNVSKIKNRDTVKWNNWILQDTPVPTPSTMPDVIGIFLGAFFHPTEFVRPKADCLMRTLGAPFDSVCAEAHLLKAFEHVSFIDKPQPASTNVVLSRNQSRLFKVKPVPIPIVRFEFEWFVDGIFQTSGVDKFTLRGSDLLAGNHEVTVYLRDNTPFVKTDPHQLKRDSFTWNVTVR
jgi:hypothetical protein